MATNGNGNSTQQLKDAEKYSVQGQAREGVYAIAPGGIAGDGFGGLLFQMGGIADDIRPWNALYPNWRDSQLRWLAKNEPMLASGLYSMKTRIAGLNSVVNDTRPRVKKHAQDLLNNCQYGHGLRAFTTRLVDDLLSTDNGGFVELWGKGRPDRPLKGGLVGFSHMDSRQCWRTFDPEFPVIYYNPQRGEYHKMHHTRVLMLSDNEQPIEIARGIGFCAVSRALRFAQIMRNTLVYRDEKISGRFNRALGVASGITRKQFQEAMQATDEEATSKGFVMYKGVPWIMMPGLGDGERIELTLTDLASVPDGFDINTETTLYAYALAFAFGVDAREFWPATASGATKADATVQNMKARGRGIGMLIETVQDVIRKLLPEGVEFEFDYTDDEQDEMETRIHKTRVETYALALDKGAINPLQMQALLIADGVLDPLVLDATPSMPVESTDNDVDEADDAAEDVVGADTEDVQEPGIGDAAPGDTEDEDEEAELKKTVDAFRRSVRSAIRGLWNSTLDVSDFTDALTSAIERQYRNAWTEGAKACGISAGELTDDEQIKLQEFITNDVGYIPGLASAVVNADKASGGALQPFFDRAELWVNRYPMVRNAGQVMACADQKMVWVLGRTEKHCTSCAGYAGKVYRGSVWRKYLEPLGKLPRQQGLECHGFNCDCNLEVTTERATPGRPPIL